MSSTIPTARTSLHAGLTALTAAGQPLAGVVVHRTGSWDERPDYDAVSVLNARDIVREPRILGALKFTERYTIPVEVHCYLEGDDIAAVETRLWQVIAAVEVYVSNSGGPRRSNLGDDRINSALPAGLLDPGEESGPTSADVLLAHGVLAIRVEAVVDLAT